MSDDYLRERAHTIKENAGASGLWQGPRRFINEVYDALEERGVPPELLEEYSDMRGDYFEDVAHELDGPGGRDRVTGIDEVNAAYAEEVADWIAGYLAEDGELPEEGPAAPEEPYEPEEGSEEEPYGPERPPEETPTGGEEEPVEEPYGPEEPGEVPEEPGEGPEPPYEEPEVEPEEPEEPEDVTDEPDRYRPAISIASVNGNIDYLSDGRTGDHNAFEDGYEALAQERDDFATEDYSKVVLGDLIGPDGSTADNEALLNYAMNDEDIEWILGDNELKLLFQDAWPGYGEDDGWVEDISAETRDAFLEYVAEGNANLAYREFEYTYLHGGTNEDIVTEENDAVRDSIREDYLAEIGRQLYEGEADEADVFDDFVGFTDRLFNEYGMTEDLTALASRDFSDIDPDTAPAQVVGQTTAQELQERDDRDEYERRNPQRRGGAVNINTVSDYLADDHDTDYIAIGVETEDGFDTLPWQPDDGGAPETGQEEEDGYEDGGEYDIDVEVSWESGGMEHATDGNRAVSALDTILSKDYDGLLDLGKKLWGQYKDENTDLDRWYSVEFTGDEVDVLERNGYNFMLEAAPGTAIGRGMGRTFVPYLNRLVQSDPVPANIYEEARAGDADQLPEETYIDNEEWGISDDPGRTYREPVNVGAVMEELDSFGLDHDSDRFGLRFKVVDDAGTVVENSDGKQLVSDWNQYDLDNHDVREAFADVDKEAWKKTMFGESDTSTADALRSFPSLFMYEGKDRGSGATPA